MRADDQENLGVERDTDAVRGDLSTTVGSFSDHAQRVADDSGAQPSSPVTDSPSRLPVENRDSGITPLCRHCHRTREEHSMGGRCIWTYNPFSDAELLAKSGKAYTEKEISSMLAQMNGSRPVTFGHGTSRRLLMTAAVLYKQLRAVQAQRSTPPIPLRPTEEGV